MKIELTDTQLDEIAKKKIEALEKEVRSLTSKLKIRDRTITKLKDRNKFSEEIRSTVLNNAEALVASLEHSDWVEYNRYGSGW